MPERCSDPEPADSLRDKSSVSGGWFRSLTLLLGFITRMFSLSPTARDAIQYWERRRIIYNAVLACIVVAGFVVAWPASLTWFSRPALPALLQSAVAANLLYCAAYGVEWLFQLSPYRESWPRRRIFLFVAGVGFASFLAGAMVVVIKLGPLDNH